MTRILVVDDSPVDRLVAGRCVEQEGLTALYAADGGEALQAIDADSPDIVLTDLQMPTLNGLELVKKLRRHHPNIPVILMTAYGSEEIAVSALHEGAASYVPKKNLKRELGRALGTVLSGLEGRSHREQVREYLRTSESQFVLGYEKIGATALISYLQNGLWQLNFCDEVGILQISTALTEALRNAIDHGNLELKSEWRESEELNYYDIGQERSKENPYRDRRVFVCARLSPTEARYVIRDEGPGFDYRTLPDPTDPENLVRPSGRGVMLIRTFMDDVSFNDTGNEITMIKHRP